MFNHEEIFLLKELIELEINEVDELIKTSNEEEKIELKTHKIKLLNILEKLKTL